MRAVIMRVRDASVSVDGKTIGAVPAGLLVYLGIGNDDTRTDLEYMLDKVTNLRIFPDKDQKMNLSVGEVGGGILVVSQFTLYGDARKGRRPSYSDAALPDKAIRIYEEFICELKEAGFSVGCGKFGAMMDVSCINAGPVTILLDSRKTF